MPLLPACSTPEDEDGYPGWPSDPGCESPEDGTEQGPCEDGLDNDDDGLIDYPDDPGCDGGDAFGESPQCDDGIDNDGDGFVDHGDDPGCLAPPDNSEESIPGFYRELAGPRCGLLGLEVLPVVAWALRRRGKRRE